MILRLPFIAALLFACVPSAESTEPSAIEPKVCLGFDATSQTWGVPLPDAQGRQVCAAHHAIYSATRAWTDKSRAEEIGVLATCCPLPSEDILVDQHVWVETNCPEQSVVTGFEQGSIKTDGRYSAQIRCTAINTERFHLAPPRSGAFWGVGATAALPWKEDTRLLRSSLPVAIRYGIERVRKLKRTSRGCVGQPVGSLFVGKTGKQCRDFKFRELLAVVPSVKPEGIEAKVTASPVAMFPDCEFIEDIFAEVPRCIR